MLFLGGRVAGASDCLMLLCTMQGILFLSSGDCLYCFQSICCVEGAFGGSTGGVSSDGCCVLLDTSLGMRCQCSTLHAFLQSVNLLQWVRICVVCT